MRKQLFLISFLIFTVIIVKSQNFENPFDISRNFISSEGLTKVAKVMAFNGDERIRKYGFQDKKGNTIIPCIYDEAGTFSSGLAPVCINRLWGYIDKTGNVVIPLKYKCAGNFSEGLAPVVYNNSIGFINIKGEWVIPPVYYHNYDTYSPLNLTGFNNGLAPVTKDGAEWFFIDKTDKNILGPYPFAAKFRNGIALVEGEKSFKLEKMYQTDDYGSYIYDENGEFVITGYDTVPIYKDLLINPLGEVVAKYYLDTLPQNLYLIEKDSTLSVFGTNINIPVKNGYTVISTPEFISVDLTYLYRPKDGKLLKSFKTSGKTDFFFVSNELHPLSYGEMNCRYLPYQKPFLGKWYLCDIETGIKVNPDGFDNVELLESGLWIVSNEIEKKGIINDMGLAILPVEYNSLKPLNNKWIMLEKDNKFGIADINGNILLPTQNTYLHNIWDNYFAFSTMPFEDFENFIGQYGIITIEGKIIIPSSYRRFVSYGGSSVLANIDTSYFLADVRDGKLCPFKEYCDIAYEMGAYYIMYADDFYWMDSDCKKLSDGDSYTYHAFPMVQLKRSGIENTGTIKITGGKWQVLVQGISDKVFDSVNVYNNCLIAYSENQNCLISKSGKIAGPYSGIALQSSKWKDNIFIVNNGGSLNKNIVHTDTVYVEDYMTGEMKPITSSYEWKCFIGGKTGIIDENANVLIEPEFDKINLVIEHFRYNEWEESFGQAEYRSVTISDASSPISYEDASISKERPALLFKGDSVYVDFWGKRNRMGFKGTDISTNDIFYTVSDEKSGKKQAVNNIATSEVFNHIMFIGGSDEIPLYIVNVGGRCDTNIIKKPELIFIEGTEPGESLEKEIIIESHKPWFTGGKFYLLSDAGIFLNKNPFENVKLMIEEFNGETFYYEYKDLSDKNSGIDINPFISSTHPLQAGSQNKWGLVNKAGQIILPIKYDSLEWKYDCFTAFLPDSVFRIDKDYKPEFISLLKPLPKKKIKFAGNNWRSDDIDPVYVTCSSCEIDTFETTTKEFYYDDYGNETIEDIIVKKPFFKGGKVGVVNKWGVQIINNEYDNIHFFYEKSDFSVGQISSSDSTGCEYYRTSASRFPIIKVKKNGLWGLVSLEGKIIAQPIYDDIYMSVDEINYTKKFELLKDNVVVKELDIEGNVVD